MRARTLAGCLRCSCRRAFSSSTARPSHATPAPIINALWTSSSLYLPVDADPLTQTVLARSPPTQEGSSTDETTQDEASSINDRALALMRRGHSHTHLEFSKSFFGHSHPGPNPQASSPNGASAHAPPGRPRHMYSAGKFYEHPPNEIVPEVLILGCSNAGKSTLINAVLDCQLARASNRPGYTKRVNAYGCGPPLELSPEQRAALGTMPPDVRSKQFEAIRHSLVLLDTPGYGHNSLKGWGEHIEKILDKRRQLRGAIILLRGDLPGKVPTDDDRRMLEILATTGKPVGVVLTRADRRGEEWPSAAWKIARDVRSILGERGDWGTDRRGRGLWDGGVWVTAAGIPRGEYQPSRDRDNVGVRGLRAVLLDMAGYRKGSKPLPGEDSIIPRGEAANASGRAPAENGRSIGEVVGDEAREREMDDEMAAEEDEEIVPFDQIPMKQPPARKSVASARSRYRRR
jgi:GTP-binding protein EngB required for normal cell division